MENMQLKMGEKDFKKWNSEAEWSQNRQFSSCAFSASLLSAQEMVL